MTRTVWFTEIDSPAGPLRLAADAEGLRHLEFLSSSRARPRPADWVDDPAPLAEAVGSCATTSPATAAPSTSRSSRRARSSSAGSGTSCCASPTAPR